jgi:hypothetical protein
MMQATRMFRDRAGNDVIFGPDPDDAWSRVPFPVIASLLQRIDDILIDEQGNVIRSFLFVSNSGGWLDG